MAKRCYLVSCVGAKLTILSKAKDLYVSDWFRKVRLYVEASGDPWFILSAEYGLVDPEAIVAPYEKTMKRMGVTERRKWASKVIEQIESLLPNSEAIVVFASASYREFLMDHLRFRAKEVLVPMQGLRIGEQLGWLESHMPRKAER